MQLQRITNKSLTNALGTPSSVQSIFVASYLLSLANCIYGIMSLKPVCAKRVKEADKLTSSEAMQMDLVIRQLGYNLSLFAA